MQIHPPQRTPLWNVTVGRVVYDSTVGVAKEILKNGLNQSRGNKVSSFCPSGGKGFCTVVSNPPWVLKVMRGEGFHVRRAD